MIAPFPGGNEAEWARYLETLLKTERDRLMSILDSMEEGVAIIGPDYKIRFMNPSMIHEFGDGNGVKCHKHLHGLDQPCPAICRLPEVVAGATERWEYNFPDGATYEVISSPFSDADQTPCILATLRNVTKQKQIQLELIRLNQLRSEVLAQITKDLDQTSQEVVRLGEEKRRFVRFLSAVVHDVRAPLAVAQSCLWTILEGFAGAVNDEQRDLLQRGSRRLDDLMVLIDDLLDIPRIETGQLVHEMEGISLNEVIRRALDGLDNVAKEKGIKLETRLPPVSPRVRGSSRRLQQVVTNLVSNAITYTAKGQVLVRVSEDNSHVKVEVMDSGIGIPPEDLPRLFEDFFRASNVQAKGTGLGLSISKRIVEAHGGRIWAESPCPESGKGSKFTFTLPRRSALLGSESNLGHVGKEA
jgi:two-component system phosphate regulon sensor histidine kinase PhoR